MHNNKHSVLTTEWRRKKQKQCNGNHFLDLSSSSWSRDTTWPFFNGNLKCAYFQWVDRGLFKRIRPFQVLWVRSDPIQVLSVRSDPIRSGPIPVLSTAMLTSIRNVKFIKLYLWIKMTKRDQESDCHCTVFASLDIYCLDISAFFNNL